MGTHPCYEIRVKSVLDRRWTAWFEHLQLSTDGEDTVISGPVADQAALHGLLTKVCDLGLYLVSVRCLDPDPAPHHAAPRNPPEDSMASNMSTAAIDPELEPFLSQFPVADLTDPQTARTNLARLAATAPAPDTTELTIEDSTVPADPDVAVRIYHPRRAHGAVVWMHGGGYVMGDLHTEHPWAAAIATMSGAVVISVGYRLAPEHPFPAGLDDVHAVLVWTTEHAGELGIDPQRIAVGGHAAGAGLAAAIALLARDQQGPPIHYQLLSQPELDDRQTTWSARHFTNTPFMTRDKVATSWRHYLASTPATPYAAPTRAEDLTGLPPAYITSAEFDPNRDEAIGYAQRLLQARVSVELHQWPGTFHGSQAITTADVSQRQTAELGAALRRALAR